MSMPVLETDAWKGIARSYASGRLAHAYAIVGSPQGAGRYFTEHLLQLLFCTSAEKPCEKCEKCRLVTEHKHVDALWIEPASKSRRIVVEDIEALISYISRTSFEGGWKAGILLDADRMISASGNKLLKILEEPPPKSMLVLVTDSPSFMLPTILSRCQTVALEDGHESSEGWRPALSSMLEDFPPNDGLSASRLASRFSVFFSMLKRGEGRPGIDEIVEADGLDDTGLKKIIEARSNAVLKKMKVDVLCMVISWHRDILMMKLGMEDSVLYHPDALQCLERQAEKHTSTSALDAVHVLEQLADRLDKNLPETHLFDDAFRKMIRN